MTPPERRPLLILLALLATAVAVVFFAISIDPEIYAPGASRGHLGVGLHLYHDLPRQAQNDLSYRRILRKGYSVVAFALVGLFSAPFLPKRNRIAATTLLVAAYSAAIEVAQKLVLHSPESLLSNAFDIACGAVGGWLGAWVLTLITRFARKPHERPGR